MITTVIPTYRRPGMLGRAIESILAQTERRVQVCVYDNASGDETAATVEAIARRDPRVTYFRHDKNIGLTGNFMFGASRIGTPFFSFLSDDDWLLPPFYEAALAALEAHPEAIFASARVADADERGRLLGIRGESWASGLHQPQEAFPRVLRAGHLEWTGILFRRRALELVDLTRTGIDILFDVDFVLRLAGMAPFVAVPVIGAVFVHRPGLGSERLAATWPALQRMAANVEGDQRIAAELRAFAREELPRQIAIRTYIIGLNAARRGQLEETAFAADILEREYGHTSQARRLRRLSALVRHVPGVRGVLEGVSAIRRYRRHGWRRRAYTVDDLVQSGQLYQPTTSTMTSTEP
ncbi:MAG: glycosyltransferase [Candidatus Dormibacteraeota bacterium]|nr:glycosyltransferase [Candidatus Dormibacteraeota bacterium]